MHLKKKTFIINNNNNNKKTENTYVSSPQRMQFQLY